MRDREHATLPVLHPAARVRPLLESGTPARSDILEPSDSNTRAEVERAPESGFVLELDERLMPMGGIPPRGTRAEVLFRMVEPILAGVSTARVPPAVPVVIASAAQSPGTARMIRSILAELVPALLS